MKPFVNLLPLRHRRRQMVRRTFAAWSPVWAACAVAVLGAAAWAWHHGAAIREAVCLAEENAAPIERLVAEQAALRTELGRYGEKGTVLGQLRGQRPLLSLLGAVSECAGRCQGRLVVQHLTFERKEERQAAADKPPPAGAKAKPAPERVEIRECVTIRGDAKDNVAVATFVVGLRDSGLFRRVELKSCARLPAAGGDTRTYLLDCEI